MKQLDRHPAALTRWAPLAEPPPLSIIDDEAAVSAVRLALSRGVAPDHPPRMCSESLEAAAMRADESAAPEGELGAVWDAFLNRELNFHAAGALSGRSYVVARARSHPEAPAGPLSRLETAMFVRVICGEQQKFVAAELGIAPSTASKWYSQALAKLHLVGQTIPLPLVLAVQTWALGVAAPPDTRRASFEHDGEKAVLLSVPRPRIATDTPLSHAEREIATLLVEGATRLEIAALRGTSIQTIACQIRGVYSKYRLTGRNALIRLGLELGWFQP